MRVSGIIHQQICQLKWHFLACLGLIMVLPIQEAVISLKEGYGFYCTNMTFAAILFGPMFAGLIACANVQGDLDEKRYIFWRSKPADITLLITFKFLTGLVVSLIILACPVVFTIFTNTLWNKEGLDEFFFVLYVPLPILMSIMTYSLCFASNVLVRKTARAWLIGMLIGCFLLVLPFMLPLNYKDYVSDILFLKFQFFLAIILIASVIAFIFAHCAAKQDWHLRTNLKGLLWVGAVLIFVLMMLFSSQVANIKVLQEKEMEISFGRNTLDYAGNRIVFQRYSYVDIDQKNSISLNNISGNPYSRIDNFTPKKQGYYVLRYPRDGMLYKNVGDDIYYFAIHAYYRKEGKDPDSKGFYEKAFVRSYKHTEKSWMPVCELNVSDCLEDDTKPIRLAMRMIDNRLIACVKDSCVVVDITDPGELKLIEKKLDVLQKYVRYTYSKEEFAIPLIPVEEIEPQERIKLSIDLNYRFYFGDNDIYESSIVDVHNGKFAFCLLEYEYLARGDVIRWDDEKIYCKFSTLRPFTILESVRGTPHFFNDIIVKNGKFYCYDDHTLMVFDIRSNRRIRKLGHFVRMDYRIEDMAVLEDGNILVCVRWDPEDFGIDSLKKEDKYYLYLLKNPE